LDALLLAAIIVWCFELSTFSIWQPGTFATLTSPHRRNRAIIAIDHRVTVCFRFRDPKINVHLRLNEQITFFSIHLPVSLFLF